MSNKKRACLGGIPKKNPADRAKHLFCALAFVKKLNIMKLHNN